ncbi:orotate phosphoribosyltransferase [Candidatus Woesearchaeota archaeon]|nr:orotate phosphoribosyltransferase [Candidatus Woesearchaeota archaeon]
MDDAASISKILLEIKAVTLNPGKPYTFVSGIRSPIYCDNRLILSYPEKRAAIINAFSELIKRNKLGCDIIAGVATSGIPFAALLAEKLGKPMVYVRPDAKKHGKGNMIEGRVEQGKKALVVEDLISTGGSSLAVVEALREAGVRVAECLAIFTYTFKKAADNFEEHNCKLYTLADFPNLIKVAAKQGYIKESELQHVLSWSRNPEQWQP